MKAEDGREIEYNANFAVNRLRPSVTNRSGAGVGICITYMRIPKRPNLKHTL
jgi:hypothetical protein